MEPDGSLQLSQKPAAFSYPEPDPSSPRSPYYFSKIHFNIILPSIRRSCKWPLSLRFPTKTMCAPLHPPFVPHVPPISLFFSCYP